MIRDRIHLSKSRIIHKLGGNEELFVSDRLPIQCFECVSPAEHIILSKDVDRGSAHTSLDLFVCSHHLGMLYKTTPSLFKKKVIPKVDKKKWELSERKFTLRRSGQTPIIFTGRRLLCTEGVTNRGWIYLTLFQNSNEAHTYYVSMTHVFFSSGFAHHKVYATSPDTILGDVGKCVDGFALYLSQVYDSGEYKDALSAVKDMADRFIVDASRG